MNTRIQLKKCERCTNGMFDPNEYKMCRRCYIKYTKICTVCKIDKYDCYHYKKCYLCSKKDFKKCVPQNINIDALELLDDE